MKVFYHGESQQWHIRDPHFQDDQLLCGLPPGQFISLPAERRLDEFERISNRCLICVSEAIKRMEETS